MTPDRWKLISTALRRGLRKRCPHCGEGQLFSGWSHLERCSSCGLVFEPNPGDTWAFTVIGDRLPIAAIIVLIYFGVVRSHRVLGLTMLAVLAVLLVWTAPNRWGAGIALHYLSRVYWPDPADPLPSSRDKQQLAFATSSRSNAVGSNSRTMTNQSARGDVPDDQDWLMDAALEQAALAREAGEVPIGAVVAIDGEVVGRGFNQPIRAGDPTAHAEIVALRDAARHVGNYRLTGATLCVTIEPCLMCVGALVHARIGTLVYGAAEPKSGAVMSAVRGAELPGLNHRFEVVSGVREDECRDLMQLFFRDRRTISNTKDTKDTKG